MQYIDPSLPNTYQISIYSQIIVTTASSSIYKWFNTYMYVLANIHKAVSMLIDDNFSYHNYN